MKTRGLVLKYISGADNKLKSNKRLQNIEEKKFIINNNKWEILTPTGWSDFSGIKKSFKNKILEIIFENNKIIKCTYNHKLKLQNGSFAYAQDLCVDDILNDNKKITKINEIDYNNFVYDILDVQKNNEYIANGVINHNCAHIQGMDQIWTGILPSVSAGGSVIAISSPNGVSNMFHRTWVDAQAKLNDFNPIKLPWNVHPEHDQEWFNKETRGQTHKYICQEFLCEFLGSGDTFIQQSDIDWLLSCVREPIDRSNLDYNIWIWEHPKVGHNYIISADVSRGDAKDYSAFHIIDTTEFEIAVEYKGKIHPDKFAYMLNEWGLKYNKALMAPENNTYGFMSISKLRELGYPRFFYHNNQTHSLHSDPNTIQYNVDTNGNPGFTTQSKSKLLALEKMAELIRNRILKSYSKRLIDELQTFNYINGKLKAAKGYNDDIIMSLAIGSWVADTVFGYQKSSKNNELSLLKAISIDRKSASSIPGLTQNEAKPLGIFLYSNPDTLRRNYGKPDSSETIERQSPSILPDYNWLIR